MNSFTIRSNDYLSKEILAYYHQDYTTFGTEGNPDFINHLKNDFNKHDQSTINLLNDSINNLTAVLEEDLQEIQKQLGLQNLTVCIVPRAKPEDYYSGNQKLFKKVVSVVADKLHGFTNGTNYIIRYKETKTTHFKYKPEFGGNGPEPYKGITKDTCKISNEVVGKNILLIDDVYTSGVYIDEDAIQSLLEKGAKNVFFYAVGKTYKGGLKYRASQVNDDSGLPF